MRVDLWRAGLAGRRVASRASRYRVAGATGVRYNHVWPRLRV